MSSVNFYRQLWADRLAEIAEENWSSLSELRKIEQALQPRSTRASTHLRQVVQQRITELEQAQSSEYLLARIEEIIEQVISTRIQSQVFFPTDEVLDIPFLLPDEKAGERWLTPTDLQQIVNLLRQHNLSLDLHWFSKYGYQRRLEISGRRHYSVPSQGYAVVLASERLRELIDLREIRFVQEGIHAPGVYLRFAFGDPPAIGIVRISAKMAVEGFHEFGNSELFEAIVEAVALAYYRDLVVPDEPKLVKSGKRRDSNSTDPVRDMRPRPLPRPRYALQRPLHLDEWRQLQQKSKHRVIGHIRWIGANFVADSNRQQMALQAVGRSLPDGYTWVRPHERGSDTLDVIEVRQSDLTERTQFLPPKRASKELDELFHQTSR